MPHGAGHHGGGGGHHHHGGFSHHHHHVNRGFSHHHHTNYGYYGRPYGIYRRRPLSWGIGFIFIIAIAVSVVVSLRFTSDGDADDSFIQYALTDRRAISFSNVFCQGLSLSIDTTPESSGGTATLYMLNTPPELTGIEQFSFSDQPSFSYEEYHYYNFYLYPGSKFKFSACFDSDPDGKVTFYLIKGKNKFDKWIDDPHTTKNKASFDIVNSCSSGSNKTFSYIVKSEDEYYIIFDTDNYISSALNVNFQFTRTFYQFSNNSVSDSCDVLLNLLSSYCSVDVPLMGQSALLELQPQSGTSIDYKDSASMTISCKPRIWMYAIICVSVFLGIVLIVVAVVSLCICVRRQKNKKYKPLVSSPGNTNAGVTPTTVGVVVNTETPPPPFNPGYQPQPTNYGSAAGAPPVYKP